MIALIAAQSENHVIGDGADIPWKVKGEQALFKEITLGGALIMGRKTYDSIGRPLPGRTTIVVTRNRELEIAGCEIANSLEEALDIAQGLAEKVFVAGGGELYQQAIDKVNAIHLTTIHASVKGDVFFPAVPEDFKLIKEDFFESNINYTYRYYEKT